MITKQEFEKQAKGEYVVIEKDYLQLLIDSLETHYQYYKNHIDEMGADELDEYVEEMIKMETLINKLNNEK